MWQGRQIDRILRWMESNIILKSLKRGMTIAIPFLTIGASALMLRSFPIPAYQQMIKSIWGGNIDYALNLIYNFTLSGLSLIFILAVSYSYGCQVDEKKASFFCITALCSYLIAFSQPDEILAIEVFDSLNLLAALVITVLSCVFLDLSYKGFHRLNKKLYSEGADIYYQRAIKSILPIAVVLVFMILANLFFGRVMTLQDSGNAQFINIYFFKKIGRGISGAILYVFVNHALWFFGIHGDNVLGDVGKFFQQGLSINAQLIAEFKPPSEIFTNSFFYTFVLCGGTGVTLCLVIGILLVSKQRDRRRLAWLSMLPVTFNINEIIIFGIPIILNPILLIPFIFVPLIILGISSFAMYIGLVPMVTKEVIWTTPVILSGILSTDSIAGGILQIVNITVGTLIYIPFIKAYERYQNRIMVEEINLLYNKVADGEASGKEVNLLEENDKLNATALMLLSDLRHAMKENKLELFYQPQVCSDGTILGAEALLRWNHFSGGYIYPPLIIELAREDGILDKLGMQIIAKAAGTLESICRKYKEPFKMSINISTVQLENPSFCDQVIDILNQHDFGNGILAIEVTEQIALSSTSIILERIERLRKVGIQFIMDDYGMGYGSAIYLKNSKFSYVKLDRCLVEDLLVNDRIESIIRSIKQMSYELGFELIAEYVETEEQRNKLEELGCHVYQGWLYSKAIEINEFEVFMEQRYLWSRKTSKQ